MSRYSARRGRPALAGRLGPVPARNFVPLSVSVPGETALHVRSVVGARVRRHREAAGLTLAETGERVGFALQTVASWERGTREPGLAALVALAELFACQPGDFFPPVDEDPLEVTVVQQNATLARQLKTLRQEFYAMRDQLVRDGLVVA